MGTPFYFWIFVLCATLVSLSPKYFKTSSSTLDFVAPVPGLKSKQKYFNFLGYVFFGFLGPINFQLQLLYCFSDLKQFFFFNYITTRNFYYSLRPVAYCIKKKYRSSFEKAFKLIFLYLPHQLLLILSFSYKPSHWFLRSSAHCLCYLSTKRVSKNRYLGVTNFNKTLVSHNSQVSNFLCKLGVYFIVMRRPVHHHARGIRGITGLSKSEASGR